MPRKGTEGTLPFIGSVSDSIDLARRLWGMTGLPTLPSPTGVAQFAQRLPQTLPSMIAPTLDLDELDKRITDLRAVEQWLDLNMSMLRTTIQSLEVQRNTIATLKSFGGTMLAAATPREPPAASEAPAPPTPRDAAEEHPEPPPAPRKGRRAAKADAAAAGALPLSPTAWWNTLQEQFTRIAAAAAADAGDEIVAGAAKAAKGAKKSARVARRRVATP
jgi:hypothetical protein